MGPLAALPDAVGAHALARSAARRRVSRRRDNGFRALYLLIAMAAVAGLAAIGVATVIQDPLVCIAAAGLAVLMLISFLEAFGLLDNR